MAAVMLATRNDLPWFYEPVRTDTEDNLVVTDCELQTHLHVDPDAWLHESGLIRLYAAAAQEEAERFTRRAIGPGTYRIAPIDIVSEIYIRNIPVSEIVSVTAGGSPLVYTALDYMGLPHLRFSTASPGVIVDYTAGYTGAVPPMLRAWILLATANLYEHRETHAEKPAVPHGFCWSMLMPFKVTLVFA